MTSAGATPVATPATVISEGPLGEVVWAAAIDAATNAPLEPAAEFSPEAPRITAAVFVHALPAGSTVSASWEYNRTSLDALTTQLDVAGPLSEQWVTFHIDRDPSVPWPEGEYTIAISIDGEIARRATIAVTPEE